MLPDPFGVYEEIRRAGPIVWNSRLGCWMAVDHSSARAALMDSDNFSSSLQGSTEDSLYGAPTMIFSDAPDHARLRRAVSKAFLIRVAKLEPRLRKLADEVVDEAVSSGHFDAVGQVAGPLPVMVVGELLGVAHSDLPMLKEASDEVVALSTTGPGRARTRRAAASQRRAFFAQHLRKPLTENGAESMLPTYVELLRGGADEAEVVASCMLLLVAGHETSTRLLSNCLLELATQPERFLPLSTREVAFTDGIEEVIRFCGPIHMLRRTAVHPVELEGTSVRTGDRIAVLVAAANRDPKVFDEPDQLLVGRQDARNHLGFGMGPHCSLGSTRGRLETRFLLEAMLTRLGDRRLKISSTEWEFAQSMFVRGPAALPLESVAW